MGASKRIERGLKILYLFSDWKWTGLAEPVAVAKKGMFSELVQNGVTGFVVQESLEALYHALLILLKDEKLRSFLGKSARVTAQRQFSLEREAEELEPCYQKIVEEVPSS